MHTHAYTHTQDDLTSIDRQTNNVLDENAAASKRAKELAESIADEATKVNTEVHKQGEQIHKIHKEVEHVENDAKKGEREATKLAKLEWCGCWYRCFTRGQASDENDKKSSSTAPSPSTAHSHSHPDGHITTKVTGDPREDETEDNLK